MLPCQPVTGGAAVLQHGLESTCLVHAAPPAWHATTIEDASQSHLRKPSSTIV